MANQLVQRSGTELNLSLTSSLRKGIPNVICQRLTSTRRIRCNKFWRFGNIVPDTYGFLFSFVGDVSEMRFLRTIYVIERSKIENKFWKEEQSIYSIRRTSEVNSIDFQIGAKWIEIGLLQPDVLLMAKLFEIILLQKWIRKN